MTDEALINRLYDIVDEITRIGGEQERTSITPGVLVTDANPSDLPTGYIKIENPRDGTYVPCLTISGLVVSDNDLVNVLFTRGTEPIALSQSANSPSNTLKVSEIWESDFGAVALQSDATGNIGIGTASPDDFLEIEGALGAGGLHLDSSSGASIKFDKGASGNSASLTYQVAGSNEWQIGTLANSDMSFFNTGRSNDDLVILDSDGKVGINTSSPDDFLEIEGALGAGGLHLDSSSGASIKFDKGASGNSASLTFQVAGSTEWQIGTLANSDMKILNTGRSATDLIILDTNGNVGINGITSPSTELDIGAGAIEFEEMTAPAAGAVNTARLFAQDNGAGKTQLAVRFNTGAIQILAVEP